MHFLPWISSTMRQPNVKNLGRQDSTPSPTGRTSAVNYRFCVPYLYPGGGVASETTAASSASRWPLHYRGRSTSGSRSVTAGTHPCWWRQGHNILTGICNGQSPTAMILRSVVKGYVPAMAGGERQQIYSAVRNLTWHLVRLESIKRLHFQAGTFL